MSKKTYKLRGFTLTELMLVITIVAILIILAIINFQRQAIRGQDSKRKADLAQLRVVFEDYYNDKGCYPNVATWNGYNCADGSGGQFFAPYTQGKRIPCDPVTNERYLYITIPEDAPPNVSACSGYKLFAALGNLQDADIPGSGCSPDPNQGCGYEPYKYNYGISIGGSIANPTFDFQAVPPTPTPEFAPGPYFCVDEFDPQRPGGRFCEIFDGLVYVYDANISCVDAFRDPGIGNCSYSYSSGTDCLTDCVNKFATVKCPATRQNLCKQP